MTQQINIFCKDISFSFSSWSSTFLLKEKQYVNIYFENNSNTL